MCGIFGFVAIGRALDDGDRLRGREALHRLAHRGPDQWGEWSDDHVYMGHRRLSILDLSELGRQPMLDSEGRVAIAVNGEIYNFRDIKGKLPSDAFKSSSDSEVALHGYRAWGMESLLDRIDGMYALVVYDGDARKLYIAVDRAGIKPVYFGTIGDNFVWASELKAVRQFASATHVSIDPEAIFDVLTYGYVPHPKTAFRGVCKLEPGHYLEVDVASGTWRKRRYWKVEPDARAISARRAAETLRELIDESVREQLMSDVPLGIFLSGGVDSSILATTVRRVQGGVTTFSIGFDDESRDETRYARIVGEQLQAEQHVEKLSANNLRELLPRMAGWYDEPFADPSALPTYRVCELARRHATVALSGDGGDELFGGYAWYRRFVRIRRVQDRLRCGLRRGPRLPLLRSGPSLLQRPVNRLARLSHTDAVELYALLMGGPTHWEKRRFRGLLEIPDDYDDYWYFRRHFKPELGPYRSLQYLDFHTFLPSDILTKVDRVSMAVSLEVRVPFLSRRLIEFAFSLPEEFLYRNDEPKGGLKFAYRRVLPPEILQRSKQGFSPPPDSLAGGTQPDHHALRKSAVAAFLDIREGADR